MKAKAAREEIMSEKIERTEAQKKAAERIKGCPNCRFDENGEVFELCGPHFDIAWAEEAELWGGE
jgi:hypothetical protein